MKDQYSIAWFLVVILLLFGVGEMIIEHMERKWERNRRKKAAQWLRDPSMRSYK